MARKIVPHIVSNQHPVLLDPTTSVLEAAKLMAERRIGAIMIVEQGRLVGIFSERDVMTRVVARERDPATTPLSAVMTPDPMTLGPDDSPHEALAVMAERGFRHLPIVDKGRIVGIVSIRDLYQAIKHELEEDLSQREAFIFDRGYGVGA